MNLVKIKEERSSFHQRIREILHLIQTTQSIDGIMKLLAFYPSFKRDKMFSQINRKINDCWEEIMNAIAHQPEEDFLNNILSNLRSLQPNTNNVN